MTFSRRLPQKHYVHYEAEMRKMFQQASEFAKTPGKVRQPLTPRRRRRQRRRVFESDSLPCFACDSPAGFFLSPGCWCGGCLPTSPLPPQAFIFRETGAEHKHEYNDEEEKQLPAEEQCALATAPWPTEVMHMRMRMRDVQG